MSSNGMLAAVQLGGSTSGKLPIQPTPGVIRRPPNTKPKQRKSRTGCMTCKAKRLKCDEKKPYCEQCTKKGIQCEGYAKNFKWKSFEDIQEQKKNAPVRRKSSSTKRSEDDDISELTDHEFRPEFARSPAELMPPPRGPFQHSSPYTFGISQQREYGSPNGLSNGFIHTPPFNNINTSPKGSDSSPMAIVALLCDPNDPNVYTPPQYEIKQETATPLLKPIPPPVSRTPPPIPGIPPLFKDIEFHESDESSPEEDEEDEEIEEITRNCVDPNDLLIRSPKRRRLNSFSSDVYDLHASREEMRIWDFYDKVTCQILSCKNGIGENPWRDDLISRAAHSEPLRHALFAMTSFHMRRYNADEGWALAITGSNRTNATIQALKKTMVDGSVFDENNIAALLVLSFSQVWDDPTLNGRAHLEGASTILEHQLRLLRRRNKQPSPFLRFLHNTWLYLDVLSSLSSIDDPYYLKFTSSTPVMSPSSPRSDRRFSDPNGIYSLQNEIDSLLGCAEDLFPLIARMSKVCKHLTTIPITEDQIPYIQEGIQIRSELINWQPPATVSIHASEDQYCKVDDIVTTAEVYRLTALLHLYRTFPPFGKDVQAIADQILNYLLVIPPDSGTLCIHIWPLMAAGCEHSDPIRRNQVRERFDEIRRKLMVANVDHSIMVLEEVWKRRDAGDRDAGWAAVAKEREWDLLLG